MQVFRRPNIELFACQFYPLAWEAIGLFKCVVRLVEYVIYFSQGESLTRYSYQGTGTVVLQM